MVWPSGRCVGPSIRNEAIIGDGDRKRAPFLVLGLAPFAFVTRRHIDIRTRSSKQPTNPPKCCTVTMVNRDYCSVKNCRFNSFSNKRTERVSFHKIPTQSHLKTVWKRFIRRGKPRNHTVGEIHSVNLVFIRGYPFSLCSLCSCFPGFVGV